LWLLVLGLDTANPTGGLMLNLIASIAQWEREMMLERQREGVARAKLEGRYKVRVPTARREDEQGSALSDRGVRKTAIAAELGVSERPVCRLLAQRGRVSPAEAPAEQSFAVEVGA
jgi:DNA invertase Pin-like site-specific DNA recombinase